MNYKNIVFIISSVLFFLITFSPFLIPKDIPFGILSNDFRKICSIVDAFFVLYPLGIIASVFGIITLTQMKKWGAKKIIYIFLLVIILFVLLFILPHTGAKLPPRKALEVTQIREIQKIYYSKFGRYAETYEELAQVTSSIYQLIDRQTGKPYADADGIGLDGGDNNPQTWSVQAFIEDPEYHYCSIKSYGYWFVCNQNGCEKIRVYKK